MGQHKGTCDRESKFLKNNNPFHKLEAVFEDLPNFYCHKTFSKCVLACRQDRNAQMYTSGEPLLLFSLGTQPLTGTVRAQQTKIGLFEPASH